MRQRRLISTGVAGLLCGLAALAALALGAPKNPPKNPPKGNGQVDITLSKGSDVLNFSNAAIGDSTNNSVVVSNGGKLAADFKLAGDLVIPAGAQGPTALTNQLQLVVSKSQAGSPDTQLYTGSVAGFNAAGSFNLGTLYPKQGSRSPKNLTLNFALSFPGTGTDAGDNALQNLGPVDQRFRIDATQHTGGPSNPGNNGNNSTPRSNGANPQTTVKGTTGTSPGPGTNLLAPTGSFGSTSNSNGGGTSSGGGSDKSNSTKTTKVPSLPAAEVQPRDGGDDAGWLTALMLAGLGLASAVFLFWSFFGVPARHGA